MTMDKKLFWVVFLVVAGAAGCATAPARSVSRGMVASTVPGTWAIVEGPRTVHAYAGFSGGELYNARATTGTNVDCDAANQTGGAVPLPADKVVSITVAAGQVACLRTTGERDYELLWHAVEHRRGPALVASAAAGNGGRQ
jgi:hypothetical protein